MPLYDYDCVACGRRIEVVHGVHAPGPVHCPSCGGGPLKKAISAPAVHFKGTGWAKRDRRATTASGTAKASGDAEKASGDAEKAPDSSKSDAAGEGPRGDKESSASSKDPSSTGGGSGGSDPSTTSSKSAGAGATANATS
jgi:putative FmdB family regulatory protein